MSQERRRSPRIRCVLPVRLYPQGEAKVIQTLTKDIGLGGMKCLTPTPRPIATNLTVELALGSGKEILSLRAQTVWFQEVPKSDQFYLGVVFKDLPEEHRRRLSRYIQSIASSQTPSW